MTEVVQAIKTEPAGLLNTAINILVSPGEAFIELEQRPHKLFPLALLLFSTIATLFWYFSIVDFDWYIDDVLANANVPEDRLEESREAMTSMSQTTFMMFALLGGTISTFLYYVVQAGYLGLISALSGDGQKFGNWFSLVLWTALPALIGIAGMVATILLSPNGQLSAYDLNPLTLRNLGMESANDSLKLFFASVNLTMLWSIGLLIAGYKQWQGSSLVKAMGVILTPYLLIAGIWAYFALI